MTVEYNFLEYSMNEDNLRIDIKPKHEDDDDFWDDDDDDHLPDDDSAITAQTQSYNVPKKSG